MTLTAPSKDYAKLHALSKEGALIGGISGLLSWDQETMMPPGATAIRSDQQAFLAELSHKKMTGAPFRKALDKLIDIETGSIIPTDLDAASTAALRRWRRDYLHATSLPKSFVVKFAKLTATAKNSWKEARESNKFTHYRPHLKKIIDMCRKKADYIGYDDHPYDALLDTFEPEMTTKQVKALFDGIRQPITSLVRRIGNATQVDDSVLYGNFPVDKQMVFVDHVLNDIGYDKTNGRVDLSAHPFSSACHPSDSRITTRVSTEHFYHNILAVLHECGHALYEMGLPAEQYGTPLCEAVSLGVHESQSRWWETRIGQSRAFWKHYLPVLHSSLNGSLSDTSVETFYRALNKVSPTMIRVEADEVTYPLHVMLRFEIELALIEGSLSVKDLPEAWNAKMKDYLDIVPTKPSEGCLQDIHWSMGAFGYFPTYTIGNMFCSQIFPAFEKDHADWEQKVSSGDLSFLVTWLRDKVHRHGRQYSGTELIEKISGQPFTSKPYIDYLEKKYSDIYGL